MRIDARIFKTLPGVALALLIAPALWANAGDVVLDGPDLVKATNVGDPTPSGDDDPNKAAAWIGLLMGTQITMTGETEGFPVTPQAWIEADAPISIGNFVPFRVYGRLGINTAPGEQLDLTQEGIKNFKSAEFGLGLERVVGTTKIGEQTIHTSVVGEWGWSSRLESEDTKPLTRLVRHYGAGIRIKEKSSGACFTAIYGRDEGAGDRGWGQYMLYGYVPIPGTKEALQIAMDATVSAGPSNPEFKQRDVLRIGILANLGAVVDLLK